MAPNYTGDEAAENSEVEEEENDEGGSDLEDEDEEEEDNESEEEGDAETLDDEDDVDDATIVAQMGRWGANYLQMKAYKDVHGNCYVQQNYAKNKSLGRWVFGQRKHYKKWSNGENSPMTQERIDMLERIGFHWGKTRAQPNFSWDTRFEELKEQATTTWSWRMITIALL